MKSCCVAPEAAKLARRRGWLVLAALAGLIALAAWLAG